MRPPCPWGKCCCFYSGLTTLAGDCLDLKRVLSFCTMRSRHSGAGATGAKVSNIIAIAWKHQTSNKVHQYFAHGQRTHAVYIPRMECWFSSALGPCAVAQCFGLRTAPARLVARGRKKKRNGSRASRDFWLLQIWHNVLAHGLVPNKKQGQAMLRALVSVTLQVG